MEFTASTKRLEAAMEKQTAQMAKLIAFNERIEETRERLGITRAAAAEKVRAEIAAETQSKGE